MMRPLSASLWGYVVPFSDLVYLVAAAALAVELVTRRTRLVRHPVYVPLAAYGIALSISTVLSSSPGPSAAKLLGEIFLLSIVVFTVHVVHSWAMLEYALLAWLAGAAVTVAVGLLSVLLFYAGVRDLDRNSGLTVYGSLPPGNYPRIRSLFFNMNMLCNYLIVSLMVALAARASGILGKTATCVAIIGISSTALFTVSPGLGGLVLAGGYGDGRCAATSGRGRPSCRCSWGVWLQGRSWHRQRFLSLPCKRRGCAGPGLSHHHGR